ncbi:MAG TPA: hemerythrin domain-containing protein [Terriglobales bacterium]|nr:hemerythrin domain-containing protein [Terriglobales bacterium]
MLRDKNLVPLSHGHQHTLALCVRIDRAMQAGDQDFGDDDLRAWQLEMSREFECEIAPHFSVEENEIFPAAARFPELQGLVTDLLAEHKLLRAFFLRAKGLSLSSSDLESFVETLAIHIRKEERELFEGMQQVMSPEEMAKLGQALTSTRDASKTCRLRSTQPE